MPFGRIRETNAEVMDLAGKLGTRSAKAIKMKAFNFSSLDQSIRQAGLANASAGDREIWREFLRDREKTLVEINRALEKISGQALVQDDERALDSPPYAGPTETTKTRVATERLGQVYFRKIVLSAYDWRCGVTGLAIQSLVEASHIIPWRQAKDRRLDPSNGMALNVLFHRAFDGGYMTFDEDWRVCLSAEVKKATEDNKILLRWEGAALKLPNKFLPCKQAMAWHREEVFGK